MRLSPENWKAAAPVSLLSGVVVLNHGHKSFDRLPHMKWRALHWMWVGLWLLQPTECGRNVALRRLGLGHERPGSFWRVHWNAHSRSADSPIRSPITLKGHAGEPAAGHSSLQCQLSLASNSLPRCQTPEWNHLRHSCSSLSASWWPHSDFCLSRAAQKNHPAEPCPNS